MRLSTGCHLILEKERLWDSVTATVDIAGLRMEKKEGCDDEALL